MTNAKAHWENIYTTKSSKEVSWYAPHLSKSLGLILELELPKDSQVIDIGGGASTLPDDLLARGFKNITVLDISSEALKVSQERLANQASSIQWLVADVIQTSFKPSYYDLWHDRAVFHFLITAGDRRKYIHNLKTAIKPGGYILMATFGPNGPLKCSGLEIVRYSAESLSKELGESFREEKQLLETHKTPFNTMQEFLYCLFKRVNTT